MIKKKKVYFCENCGNTLESLWDGTGIVKCCGQKINELKPNTTGASKAIHVPVIKREGSKVTVSVGEEPHPMTRDDHFILFIEVLAGDKVLRHDFKEGDGKAEASFLVEEGVPVKARAFCNLDDFWESN
jgi:superoxide reductase